MLSFCFCGFKKNHSAIELISTFDEISIMMKIWIILFSTFAIFTFAQNFEYKSILNISTSSIFAGRIDVGYMQQINDQFWLGAELGYGSGTLLFFNENENRNSSSSYRISPEIYFDISPIAKSMNLFSLQLFHSKNSAQLFEGDFYNKNGKYTYTSADFEKTRTGVNVNYSAVFNRAGNNFTIMPKIGVGLREKKIKFSNIVDLEETEELIDFVPFVNREEGTNIRPNFNFDIKLIYRF